MVVEGQKEVEILSGEVIEAIDEAIKMGDCGFASWIKLLKTLVFKSKEGTQDGEKSSLACNFLESLKYLPYS